MKNPVWSLIDPEKDGYQADYARVPHSSDRSAYGWLPVPMICLKGGTGPTALLVAGTHGDEYEGQIALRRLLPALRATRITGRVIILPALNQPAVAAARRNSPLDGGNLNRLFPGDAMGGPTGVIAHYITQQLFPICDLVIDLHSGGSSLDYLPVTFAHRGRDAAQDGRITALLQSFAAPNAILTDGRGGGGATTLYASAAAHGVAALTTELGGGPGLSPGGVALAEAGLRRVLRDFGIAPDLEAPAPSPMRWLRMQPPETGIYARTGGLFEPRVNVGDQVSPGDLAGLLYPLEDATAPPQELRFGTGGIVIHRRFPVHCAPGDALAGLAARSD